MKRKTKFYEAKELTLKLKFSSWKKQFNKKLQIEHENVIRWRNAKSL